MAYVSRITLKLTAERWQEWRDFTYGMPKGVS